MFRHTQLSHFLFHIQKNISYPHCGYGSSMWNISPENRFPMVGNPIGKLQGAPEDERLPQALQALLHVTGGSHDLRTDSDLEDPGPGKSLIAGIHCQHHMQYILCVCVYMYVYMYVYSYIHMQVIVLNYLSSYF